MGGFTVSEQHASLPKSRPGSLSRRLEAAPRSPTQPERNPREWMSGWAFIPSILLLHPGVTFLDRPVTCILSVPTRTLEPVITID
jgi:hypothetical protein